MQAQSSSHSHLFIISKFSVQAHAWIVVEKECSEAVARLHLSDGS